MTTTLDKGHKKRKNLLEGSLVCVLFVAERLFLKIRVLKLTQNTPNANIESSKKSKLLYFLCDQLLGTLIYLHFIALILICF